MNSFVFQRDNIYKFGVNLGIAFQLQDDYLEQLGGKIYNSIKNIGCVEAIIDENW